MSSFFARHKASLWMSAIALMVIGVIARPAFSSYVVLLLLAGWMLATREVAIIEGHTARATPKAWLMVVGLTVCATSLLWLGFRMFSGSMMVLD